MNNMEGTITTLDYTILVSSSLLTLGVGLYYALSKRPKSIEDYFIGNRGLNCLAVGLSIAASLLSTVAVTAMPADVYYYGVQWGFLYNIAILITVATSYFYITPVLYRIREISIYKYLESRFDTKVKKITSFLCTVQLAILSSIIIYLTAVPITTVTNQNLNLVISIISVTCGIYSVLGGIKAVVWTDVVQYSIMVLSIATVSINGIMKVGGISNFFQLAYKSGRLNLDFDLDPTKRETFWSASIGGVCVFTTMYSCSQMIMQRFVSLKHYQDVKTAHIISGIAWFLIFFLCVLSGVSATTLYIFCDPLSTGTIKKVDHMLPFVVLDASKTFPGLAGFYFAGIFNAGLSTLSTGFNSTAAVIYYDFVKDALPKKIIDKYEIHFIKFLTLVVAIIVTCMAYSIEHLGNVMLMVLSSASLTAGPVLGLFFAGLFIPTINSTGAFWGGISSMLISGWIILASTWYKINGAITYPTLPVYTDNCQNNITKITLNTPNETSIASDVPMIYKITHHLHPIIGFSIVIMVSYIISYFTQNRNHQVDDALLSPLVHYIRGKRRRMLTANYNTVEESIRVTNTLEH